LDKRIIESDIRRNLYLEEKGWKIIRIKWSDYQKLDNKREFIKNLKLQL
jgi:very-short-patch-repair endonuclease